MAKYARNNNNGYTFYHGDVCEALKEDILKLGVEIRLNYARAKTEKVKFKEIRRKYKFGRISTDEFRKTVKAIRLERNRLAIELQKVIIQRGLLMDKYHKAYGIVSALRAKA